MGHGERPHYQGKVGVGESGAGNSDLLPKTGSERVFNTSNTGICVE